MHYVLIKFVSGSVNNVQVYENKTEAIKTCIEYNLQLIDGANSEASAVTKSVRVMIASNSIDAAFRVMESSSLLRWIWDEPNRMEIWSEKHS